MKLCFIVPVYKHVATMEQVLEKLQVFNCPIVVIDDGNSLEDHNKLKQICAPYQRLSSIAKLHKHSSLSPNLDTTPKLDQVTPAPCPEPCHSQDQDQGQCHALSQCHEQAGEQLQAQDQTEVQVQSLELAQAGEHAHAQGLEQALCHEQKLERALEHEQKLERAQELADGAWVHFLSYPLNQGKGCAVCQGFMWAYNHGFTHALQIDADLQHDVNDVAKFIKLAKEQPLALISGKPIYDSSIPKARLYGRKVTDFWVIIETLSFSLKDSMCGFRVYPLEATIACIKEQGFKRHMDFDTDLLVKLYRRGLEVLYIDTKVTYPQDGHSNFQALKDNIAISLMHSSLVLSLPKYIKPLIARKFNSPKSDNKQWESKPEKKGLLGMEILLFINKYGGPYLFKAVLLLVVGCFWAFDSKARLASNNWFKVVNDYRLKRGQEQVKNTASLSHFYAFALAMYDKIAAWQGKIVLNKNAFMGDDNSQKIFEQLSERPANARGVVILCSHLGNMEVCRALARKEGTIVNALMYTKNSQRFKQIMDKYIKVDDLNIVEVDGIDAYTSMVLDERVARGELIAIAADRVAVANKTAVCHVPFMDKKCAIPTGPFILSSVLKCEVYLLFSAKTDEGIKIFFERFAMPERLSRKNREEQLYALSARYAERLEHYAALYPNQWFNFYDYFVEE